MLTLALSLAAFWVVTGFAAAAALYAYYTDPTVMGPNYAPKEAQSHAMKVATWVGLFVFIVFKIETGEWVPSGFRFR